MIIRSNAFVGLVASVAEGFKDEVGGLVFGDSFVTTKKFVVDFVVPLQTTKRKPTEVHYHPKSTSLIAEETGISQRQALRVVTGESNANSRFFEKIEGGYQLTDAGIYWTLDEILPNLPKET